MKARASKQVVRGGIAIESTITLTVMSTVSSYYCRITEDYITRMSDRHVRMLIMFAVSILWQLAMNAELSCQLIEFQQCVCQQCTGASGALFTHMANPNFTYRMYRAPGNHMVSRV